MIYLDNAATTLHNQRQVLEGVMGAFGNLGNTGCGAWAPPVTEWGTV